MTKVLHIDSSARVAGSISRDLSAEVVGKFPGARVIHRDVGVNALPHITDPWVTATFTPAEARSFEQKEVLAQSDTLVDELLDADTIVIGVSMYNFSVPASLKAWVDMVARARPALEDAASQAMELERPVAVVARAGIVRVSLAMAMGAEAAALAFQIRYLGATRLTCSSGGFAVPAENEQMV